jgi:hypothetical protein
MGRVGTTASRGSRLDWVLAVDLESGSNAGPCRNSTAFLYARKGGLPTLRQTRTFLPTRTSRLIDDHRNNDSSSCVASSETRSKRNGSRSTRNALSHAST